MNDTAIGRIRGHGHALFPGLAASLTVAAAATYLAVQYGAPVMLFALLLGMSMNFLAEQGPCKAGIEFAAKHLLRVGVALLGLRITFAQIAALGWEPIGIVVVAVVVTILLSVAAARMLGFQPLFGLLTGGATAICGASAALALSAALPPHPDKERATLFTVIGVSALSTIAMIVYPMIVHGLSLTPLQAGAFVGGTIHDVAQVVGAGYSLSQQTGDTATVVKLMRVAMLLPVVLCAALIARGRSAEEGGRRPPLLPGFAVAFVILAAINSTGWVPAAVQQSGSDLSTWCLVGSISAIGMKTQLKEFAAVGFKPIVLMIGETAFLAGLTLLLLLLAG